MLLAEAPLVGTPPQVTVFGIITGPGAPVHAGQPSRKSGKVLNVMFMYPLPALLASLITCCPSAPTRKLCIPCVHETWSAASNWLLVLLSPKAVFEPKLRPPSPLMVISEKLSTPGVKSPIPNWELVRFVVVFATAMTRCYETRASLTMLF